MMKQKTVLSIAALAMFGSLAAARADTKLLWRTSTSGATIAGSSSHFNVSGSHQYFEEGTYHASVQVIDDGGSTATAASTVSVLDAPLTISSISACTVDNGSGPHRPDTARQIAALRTRSSRRRAVREG